ncbi:hypothetical protein [Litoribrevibacter albus]|nr:hypothetical protein [Litoribrevibacter albus]
MFQSSIKTYFPLTCSRLSLAACVFILSAFSPVVSATSVANDARPVVICYENLDYVPFMMGEEEVPDYKPGVLIDLIRTAAPDQPFDFQRKPWKRCIKLLKDGKMDGMFATIWLKERDQWGQFPPATKQFGVPAEQRYRLWHVQYQIFINRASLLKWDGHQFSGFRGIGLSAPPGYVAKIKLEELGVLASGSYTASEGFKLVALDRLEGYVVEKLIGLQTIYRIPTELRNRISYIKEPLFNADWHLVFSHQFMSDHAEIAQGVWDGLADVPMEERQAIFQRYSDLYSLDVDREIQ